MQVNDRVRLYEGEWFTEGQIKEISGERIVVDYHDWLQEYDRADLVEDVRFFQRFWMPRAIGKRLKTY